MNTRLNIPLTLVIYSLLFISGCSNFDLDDAKTIVTQVGSNNLSKAVSELQYRKQENLAVGDWPNILKDLNPERIYTTGNGVYIVMYRRFIEEHGIYIQFPGAKHPELRGTDQEFKVIEEDIFWYLIAG